MEPLSGRAGRAALRRLASIPRPLIFLDVDGTLAPLAERPRAARVPESTRDTLASLRGTGAGIVLVSGRAARDARRIAGSEFDAILGNHGAEVLQRGKVRPWVRGSTTGLLTSERALRRLLALEWPGVRVEHKGRSIALHHRLTSPRKRELLEIVRKVLHADIAALPGRQVIDVRARKADKGAAVRRWMSLMESGRVPLAQVMYAGDDTTDEDAFRALGHGAITIAVGPRPGHARFRTATPQSLARWLERLHRLRKAKGGS